MRTCLLTCLLGLLACTAAAQALPGVLYTVDKAHSLLDFTADHHGFGQVRGAFDDYRGAVYLAGDDLTDASATFTLATASLRTGHRGRDTILRTKFFEADAYPILHFQTTAIEARGEGHYEATGQLTIRDVTRTVSFPFRALATGTPDQFRHRRIALTGTLTLDRRDYGVFYRGNTFWDGIVSDSVQIHFSIGARIFNAVDSVFPWRDNSIGTRVLHAFDAEGLDAALATADRLFQEQNETHDLRWTQLYRAALNLAQRGFPDAAVALLGHTIPLYGDALTPTDRADLLVAQAEVWHQQQQTDEARRLIAQALAADAAHPGALELQRHLQP